MQSPRAIIMRCLRNSKHARRTKTPRSQLRNISDYMGQ